MARILVIDDSEVIRNLLEDFLIDAGHEVTTAADGAKGVEAALEGDYDICICDTHLPKKNGYEVLTELEGLRDRMQFIFTDSMPDQLSEQIRSVSGCYHIRKPFGLDQIRILVDKALTPEKSL